MRTLEKDSRKAGRRTDGGRPEGADAELLAAQSAGGSLPLAGAFAIFALLLLALLPAPAAQSGDYAYPLLSNNVRSTTPAFNSTLDIQLVPFCENEERIAVRVSQRGAPLADVEVDLYNYSAGRALDSLVFTNADGWAYFKPRPAGRYDMTASTPDNSTGGQIYFDIPPCLSPSSGAPFGPMNWTAGTQDKLLMEQNYAGGLAREFYLVRLASGEIGTRVVLRAGLSGDGQNWTLTEQIPAGMAPSERALGFERDYPQEVRTGQTAELKWRMEASVPAEVERSYVLLRPLDAGMARLWTAPTLELAAQNATGNETQTANGSAASNASNLSQAANSTSNSGAPILEPLAGMDVGPALIGLVLAAGALALGAALLRRRKEGKKEE
ncbi:MAG: DUF4198 domain-containing protein [Candidatus Marsarchaeota archaeon]|nr:DUF4198 domain-containing protein [Candidatus Marsarchaeota archaeon]